MRWCQTSTAGMVSKKGFGLCFGPLGMNCGLVEEWTGPRSLPEGCPWGMTWTFSDDGVVPDAVRELGGGAGGGLADILRMGDLLSLIHI